MQAINMLIQTRRLIHQATAELSQEQLLHIPPGFDNNIAWNLGHIVVVQQLLHYRQAGLAMHVSNEQVAMYRSGTSPVDWDVEPDTTQFLPMLDELAQRLKVDYQAGKFANYQPYSTRSGISMPLIEDAISFNNFHEGLHLGFIQALKNLVLG